jgi:glutamine cyclotransferase
MTRNYDVTLRFAFPPPAIPDGVAVQPVEILAEYPHDPEAFTQGLLWSDGRLFESIGRVGRSELRELRLRNGAVIRRGLFPPDAHGEGIADWQDEIVAVTLQSGIALRWERDGLAPLASLPFPGTSWGLARIGDALVASDGTATLRFVDPETMEVKRALEVSEAGGPLTLVNALAPVKGELLANIFMTETIARIDPETGKATGRLDLSEAVARSGRRDIRNVLNGIAYDADEDRLFVTGKNWPKLFEISLPPPPAAP